MANLSLKNINKIYPNGVQAVFDFNLDIEDKEFIVFVGPSGCGKSTTLRMIAGLEEISSGELYIDNTLVNDVHPKERNIAMVFQSYALYPHMSVYENMAFALKLRGIHEDEIDEKVSRAATILGLSDYLQRKPKELSGGQRQRVALGRAIVRDAKVFLMDEPLSNLDAKLRVQTRAELIKLHHQLQTTTIYVTHDQVEAMTMASKIVVMRDGFIMQIGEPKTVYDYPNNMFVAGFIGTPAMNFIKGIVNEDGTISINEEKLVIPKEKYEILKYNKAIGHEVVLGIRPEDMYDPTAPDCKYNQVLLKAKIDVVELLGAETIISAVINQTPIAASINTRFYGKMGDEVTFGINMDKCHFFNEESELRYVSEEEQNLFQGIDMRIIKSIREKHLALSKKAPKKSFFAKVKDSLKSKKK